MSHVGRVTYLKDGYTKLSNQEYTHGIGGSLKATVYSAIMSPVGTRRVTYLKDGYTKLSSQDFHYPYGKVLLFLIIVTHMSG